MAVARTRVRDRIVRRQGILKAAAGVFIRGGYRAATMEDVAAAAGIGVGTLYHYFRSKEHLFASILAEANGILAERLQEAAAKKLPPSFGLVAISRAYVDYLAEYPDYFRLQMTFQQGPLQGKELEKERRKAEKLARQNLDLFAEKIREGQRSGIFRGELDPLATATALWASYNGVLFAVMNAQLLELTELSAERLLSAAASLHFSGLSGDATLAPQIIGSNGDGGEVSLHDLQGLVRSVRWIEPAAIFSGMRLAFRPEKAKGIRETYRFELAGDRGGTWTVRVEDGTMEVIRGEGPPPTVVMRMSDRRFVELTSGQVEGVELITRGEMRIEGDLQRAAMFSGFFLEG